MILWIATFGMIGGMMLVLGGVLAVAGRQTRLEEEPWRVATVVEVSGSQAVYVSQPHAVAELIGKAAKEV